MPISPSLSRKLRDTLGQDAGGDLVTWLDEQREQWTRLALDVAAFRQDMAAMETRLSAQIAQLRNDSTERSAEMKSELSKEISDVKSDLMKWSFVFWCGAVAAVAALAGVLRH